MTTMADLETEWRESLTPKTEREPETMLQHMWAHEGYVVQRGLLDDDELVDPYLREWWAYNGLRDDVEPGDEEAFTPQSWKRPGGWPYATPYMKHEALRRIVCDPRIARTLEELIGEPAGVHLNLTGWVSTTRDWHRDQYLNEPGVGDFYVAVWIALDTIFEDAGPFEFIPGSHKAKPIDQTKMREALGADGRSPEWPAHSERILTPLFEEEVVKPARASGRVKTFLGKKGDVLFWHGRLLHRGSTPTNIARPRRGLIAHYSGIDHRPDMPRAVQHEAGGWFFPLTGGQPTKYKEHG